MGASFFKLIEQAGRAYGDREFLFDGSSRISFERLHETSCQLARFFHSKGLGQGDVVLVCLPNWIEYVQIYAATTACGAVFATAPASSKAQRLIDIVELVKPKMVFTLSSAQIDTLCASQYAGTIYDVRLGDARCAHYDEILTTPSGSAEDADLDSFEPTREMDVSTILFTSGATGTPKAVLCNAFALEYIARQVTASIHVDEEDVFYIPLAFCHVFGLSSGLYAPLVFGKRIVTGERYNPERALELIESEHCTIQVGVPTMFIRQLKLARLTDRPIPLRAGIVGGGGRPPGLIAEFEAYTGCKLLPSYGMTETTGGVTATDIDAPQEQRYHAEGTPLKGVECVVWDSDARPLPAGTIGRLAVKTIGIMGGYHTGGALASDAHLPHEWFETGDVGFIDAQGYVHVTDRMCDVIIRGGMNVWPSEVERVYSVLPEVAEAALVAYPDDELGERTCLGVVLTHTDGLDNPTDLRNYAHGHLEKHKVPDKIIILDDLPRLESSNKIDKRALALLARGE